MAGGLRIGIEWSEEVTLSAPWNVRGRVTVESRTSEEDGDQLYDFFFIEETLRGDRREAHLS